MLHCIKSALLLTPNFAKLASYSPLEIDPAPSNVRVPGKLDLTADAREWLKRRWLWWGCLRRKLPDYSPFTRSRHSNGMAASLRKSCRRS